MVLMLACENNLPVLDSDQMLDHDQNFNAQKVSKNTLKKLIGYCTHKKRKRKQKSAHFWHNPGNKQQVK